MHWLRSGAALVVLATASYAWSQPAGQPLGAPMPSLSGGAKPGRAPAISFKGGVDASAFRYGRALGALRPEGRLATRGAKEAQVYRDASPAVVLVLSDDSLGSGALISADGKIVTNLHVVGDSDQVGVVFKPKAEGAAISKADVVMARVIRRDEVADLALIQVAETPAGVTPLAIGAAGDVEVGANVHAIGHPTGETWTYTQGIVSQIRRDYVWSADDRVSHKATVIQTQTPINPGNSGGPLINDDMKIVGINSFIEDGEGINFAVSGDDVKAFLARDGDRKLAASEKASTKKAAACEGDVLGERRSDDDKATNYILDVDCDGKGDMLASDPDDKKQPMLWMLDVDKDGKIDTVMYDDDRDGNFDLMLVDSDADGKPDTRGLFRRGENKPYKYEKIED